VKRLALEAPRPGSKCYPSLSAPAWLFIYWSKELNNNLQPRQVRQKFKGTGALNVLFRHCSFLRKKKKKTKQKTSVANIKISRGHARRTVKSGITNAGNCVLKIDIPK
jgi:hypothetical protein